MSVTPAGHCQNNAGRHFCRPNDCPSDQSRAFWNSSTVIPAPEIRLRRVPGLMFLFPWTGMARLYRCPGFFITWWEPLGATDNEAELLECRNSVLSRYPWQFRHSQESTCQSCLPGLVWSVSFCHGISLPLPAYSAATARKASFTFSIASSIVSPCVAKPGGGNDHRIPAFRLRAKPNATFVSTLRLLIVVGSNGGRVLTDYRHGFVSSGLSLFPGVGATMIRRDPNGSSLHSSSRAKVPTCGANKGGSMSAPSNSTSGSWHSTANL